MSTIESAIYEPTEMTNRATIELSRAGIPKLPWGVLSMIDEFRGTLPHPPSLMRLHPDVLKGICVWRVGSVRYDVLLVTKDLRSTMQHLMGFHVRTDYRGKRQEGRVRRVGKFVYLSAPMAEHRIRLSSGRQKEWCIVGVRVPIRDKEIDEKFRKRYRQVHGHDYEDGTVPWCENPTDPL